MNLTRIAAVIRRHGIVLRRSPHRWFEISFWPVMDVVLWGSLGAYVARQASTSKATTPYLLTGITLFWIFTQAQFSIALGLNEETWTRNILNVLTTPVRDAEYIVGIAVFGLFKLASCLIVLAVATKALFGYTIASVGWSVLPLGALLVVNGWSLGLIAAGLVLRFGQSAEILIWGLNYVMLSFAGVFFPVDALPGPLRWLAKAIPTTNLFGAARVRLDGGRIGWTSVGAAALGSAVFFALSLAIVGHLLRVFRRRGFVTRYS